MSFSTAPIRANGVRIEYGWFNVLRSAGLLLEEYLGAVLISETSFTIVNNQSSAADVTGLLFSGAAVRSFIVDYYIYRNTTGAGATELSETGQLMGVYSTVAAAWEMTQINVGSTNGNTTINDTPSGVNLSITAAGQVQYTSSNITGSAATSKMKFKARTMAI